MKMIVDEFRLHYFFVVASPIPQDDLLLLLGQKGFREIDEVPKRIGSEVFGIERINIARKAGCQILYDETKGMLGVSSTNIEGALKCFTELKSVIEDAGIEISSQVKFYELSLNGRVFAKGKIKPLETISKFIGEDKLSQFKTIMGAEVAPFSVRFYPKEQIKTISNLRKRPVWFDFQIYPYVPNPQYYGVKVVIRNTDIKQFKNGVSQVEKKVLQVIETIRRG